MIVSRPQPGAKYITINSHIGFVSLLVLALMLFGIDNSFAGMDRTVMAKVGSITMSDSFQPKRIIVLGDSYSDNGNVYRLSNQQYPNSHAYYQGRFTDGLVWTEYFAKLMKIDPNDPNQFINLAYGQAKVLAPTSITVYGNPNQEYAIPDLAEEINTFVKQHDKFDSTDLVIVFISANDFFDISATDPLAKEFFIQIASHQVTEIQRLVSLGARHILVLNGRDVTFAPLATRVAQTNTKSLDESLIKNYLQQFRELIQIYNRQLSDQLAKITNSEVVLYDTFQFDNNMINIAHQFNANGMCYQNIVGNYQDVAGVICTNPDQFFYYDRIHTTSIVNSLLAEDVYRTFQQKTSNGSDFNDSIQ